MAGARINLRTIVADVLDEFKTNGALAGSTTTRGGLVWAKKGTQTTVATVADGVVKATSGTGNTPYVLNTGRANFSIGYTVASIPITGINTPVWRVDATGESWWAILHRSTVAIPEYVIAWRGTSGSYNMLIQTGVVPKVGDHVRVDVLAGNITLFVNGVNLGSAPMTTNAEHLNAGLMVNSSDLVSGFSDYAVYLK